MAIVHFVSHDFKRSACGVDYAERVKRPGTMTEDVALVTCGRCAKSINKSAAEGRMIFDDKSDTREGGLNV